MIAEYDLDTLGDLEGVKVDGFPTCYLWPMNSSKMIKFDGKRDPEGIEFFLGEKSNVFKNI